METKAKKGFALFYFLMLVMSCFIVFLIPTTVRGATIDPTLSSGSMFVAGSGIINEYYRSNLTYKDNTSGNNFYSIAQDDLYIYGADGYDIHQYWKSNLTTKQSASGISDSLIQSIAIDENYIYATVHLDSDGTDRIYRYFKSDFSYKDRSPDYGGTIYSIAIDNTYVYAGGATTEKVRRYYKTNLDYKDQSPSYGNEIDSVIVDGTYVYAAGKVSDPVRVRQYHVSNLAAAGDYSIGVNCKSIAQDVTYIYLGRLTAPGKCTQLWKSNMSKKANVATEVGSGAVAVDDTYVYVGDGLKVYKCLKSNLSYDSNVSTTGTTVYEISIYDPITISSTNPTNEETNIASDYGSYDAIINEPHARTFDWTIETSLGDSAGGSGTSGIKECTMGLIPSLTNVTVWVNTTDTEGITIVNSYWFISMLQPNAPTSLDATAESTVLINVSWMPDAAADTTYIRYDTINHSAGTWTRSVGTLGYNGTDNYFTIAALQNTTYYFAFWTYNETYNCFGPITYSDSRVQATTGIAGVSLPIAATTGTGGKNLLVTWAKGGGLTTDDYTLVYYDTIEHIVWNMTNGTLLTNTTSTNALITVSDYNITIYFALFTYNSTYNLLSTTCYLINGTSLPSSPVDDVTVFNSTANAADEIYLQFIPPTGADKIYIEYFYDSAPVSWEIGDGRFACNESSSYSFMGLQANRGYWFKAWGYNASYNVFSINGKIDFARTLISSLDRKFVGDNYHDIVHYPNTALGDDWVDHIYPHWTITNHDLITHWWNHHAADDYKIHNPGHGPYLGELGEWNWLEEHYLIKSIYCPNSWWKYWLDTYHLDATSPDTTHFGEYQNKIGPYAWHVVNVGKGTNGESNAIEFTYDNEISGGLTGIGFYVADESAQQQIKPSSYKNQDYDYYIVEGGEKTAFPDYTDMPASLGLHFSNLNNLISPATGIHLQINNQPMPNGIIVQNGIDEYYQQNKFLYFDLSNAPLLFEDQTLFFKLLIDGKSTGRIYAFFTTATDVDCDQDTGIYFSSGVDAVNNYNSGTIQGIYDPNRDLNYFFTYNSNLHPASETPSMTGTDRIIVTPDSLGKYETTNIIYILQSTAYLNNISVLSPTGTLIYTKFVEGTNGNFFFTPNVSGIFSIVLTRNNASIITKKFQVLEQTSHGYIYAADNPAITNQLVAFHVYYDITDYPAIMKMETPSGTVITQWTIPSNRSTNLYSFSYQVTTEGRYYLKLYQQRTYDEQMITSYEFYVKNREYEATIVPSSYAPHIGDDVTLTVTSNIVGYSGLNLNYYITSIGNALKKEDKLGNDFVNTIHFTPATWGGQWNLQIIFSYIGIADISLTETNITITEALTTPVVPEVTPPAVNLPSLISQAGPALGISDPMFRIIIGVIILVIFLILPLLVGWKLQFKYAEKLMSNPMIYSVMAIAGSFVSYALDLFPLWIFVLIFILAITFLIRAWRGQHSGTME